MSLLALAAFAVIALFPRAAFAETVSIPNAPASLGRIDANGNAVTLRGSANYPYGISLSDCTADQSITFPLNISGFSATDSFQVWAGPSTADCSDDAQRGTTTGSQTCWNVSKANLPLTASQTVAVKVRDIIASPTTKTASYVNQDASICGTIPFSTFNVYFILVSGTAAQANAMQTIQANTIGPPAVTNVQVEQGDTRLHVTWTAVGSTTDEAGTTTSTSTTTASQVAIYYQVAGAGGSNADAGTTAVCKDGGSTIEDAGLDDSGDASSVVVENDGGCVLVPNEATGSTCSAPGFTSTGPDSTVNSITVNATSSDAEIDGLTNGTTYAVAVVAQDLFLNAGTISSLICQSPIELNDFYETYRNDGGQAGGSCALDRVGGNGSGTALSVIAFSLVVTIARRRKRVPARAPEGQDQE